MAYLGFLIPSLLVVIGTFLLIFPDYSKKHFFDASRNVRIAGIIVLILAGLFAKVDMRVALASQLLEDFNNSLQQKTEMTNMDAK